MYNGLGVGVTIDRLDMQVDPRTKSPFSFG